MCLKFSHKSVFICIRGSRESQSRKTPDINKIYITLQSPKEDAAEDGHNHRDSTYTNVAELQQAMHSAPPAPPDADTKPLKELDDEWSVYVDYSSSRQYYYNHVTKETTWKPPRVNRKEATSSASTISAPVPPVSPPSPSNGQKVSEK